MPRTVINAVAADAAGVLAFREFAWTAADVANKNSTPYGSGKHMILYRNVNAASPLVSHTIKLSSIYGDIQKAVPGSSYGILPPINNQGYKQNDSNVYFEADSSEIEFAVVAQP